LGIRSILVADEGLLWLVNEFKKTGELPNDLVVKTSVLTRGLAKELVQYNILVNAISPGVITTPFHDRFSTPEMRKNMVSQIPLGREGTPDETIGAALFLASSYADYITGEIIEINGGQLMS
jgi:3-oxoacyl-[acyl-carrier protein] reductase